MKLLNVFPKMKIKFIKEGILPLVVGLMFVYAEAIDLISKGEAIKIVKEGILEGDTLTIRLYIIPKPLLKDSGLIIENDAPPLFSRSYNSPFSECWFFFIDDYPMAKFPHACRYLFLYKPKNDSTLWYKYSIIDEEFPPSLLDEMEQVIPIQGEK